MKYLISVLLIMLLSFASCLYFPWWSIAVVSFVVTLIFPSHYIFAFLKGFLAIFLLWFGLCFWLSFRNSHILAERMSMLILNVSSPFLLVLLTATIGGLVAGFAALSASLLRGKS